MNLLFGKVRDKQERQGVAIANLQRGQWRKSLELCSGKEYEVDLGEEYKNDDNDIIIGVSRYMRGVRGDWGGRGNRNGEDIYYEEWN